MGRRGDAGTKKATWLSERHFEPAARNKFLLHVRYFDSILLSVTATGIYITRQCTGSVYLAQMVRGPLFVTSDSEIEKPIRSCWYVVLGIAPGQSGVPYRNGNLGIFMYWQFRQSAAQAAA
jgi:hypothetical protein